MGFSLNDYEPVEVRIDAFYKEHPNGRIVTEIEAERDDFKFVIFRASVFRDENSALPAATGFAYEVKDGTNVNRTSHIENCETSAIGRALANLNYAAKGKRPSREEMSKSAGEARPSQPTPKAGAKASPASSGSASREAEPEGAGKPSSPSEGPPPSDPAPSPSLDLILDAVETKQVAQRRVLSTANRIALERECIPASGIGPDTIAELPEDVLAEIAVELGLREEVPA